MADNKEYDTIFVVQDMTPLLRARSEKWEKIRKKHKKWQIKTINDCVVYKLKSLWPLW